MMACDKCRGDGIRVVTRHDHPMTNVAGLYPHLDEKGNFSSWRGKCVWCDGRGIIEWRRGMSLPPLTPRTGRDLSRFPS